MGPKSTIEVLLEDGGEGVGWGKNGMGRGGGVLAHANAPTKQQAGGLRGLARGSREVPTSWGYSCGLRGVPISRGYSSTISSPWSLLDHSLRAAIGGHVAPKCGAREHNTVAMGGPRHSHPVMSIPCNKQLCIPQACALASMPPGEHALPQACAPWSLECRLIHHVLGAVWLARDNAWSSYVPWHLRASTMHVSYMYRAGYV